MDQCSNTFCCTFTLGPPVYRPQFLGLISGLYRQVSLYTVKPVDSDHSRDQVMVVSVDRWSSYRGALVSLRWPMEQPTVVTIDRWSLYRGVLISLRWPMKQPTVVSILKDSFTVCIYVRSSHLCPGVTSDTLHVI